MLTVLANPWPEALPMSQPLQQRGLYVECGRRLAQHFRYLVDIDQPKMPGDMIFGEATPVVHNTILPS